MIAAEDDGSGMTDMLLINESCDESPKLLVPLRLNPMMDSPTLERAPVNIAVLPPFGVIATENASAPVRVNSKCRPSKLSGIPVSVEVVKIL